MSQKLTKSIWISFLVCLILYGLGHIYFLNSQINHFLLTNIIYILFLFASIVGIIYYQQKDLNASRIQTAIISINLLILLCLVFDNVWFQDSYLLFFTIGAILLGLFIKEKTKYILFTLWGIGTLIFFLHNLIYPFKQGIDLEAFYETQTNQLIIDSEENINKEIAYIQVDQNIYLIKEWTQIINLKTNDTIIYFSQKKLEETTVSIETQSGWMLQINEQSYISLVDNNISIQNGSIKQIKDTTNLVFQSNLKNYIKEQLWIVRINKTSIQISEIIIKSVAKFNKKYTTYLDNLEEIKEILGIENIQKISNQIDNGNFNNNIWSKIKDAIEISETKKRFNK